MGRKKQDAFESAVAEAARSAKPARPRGRVSPANLTAAGRAAGLRGMHAAPRCQASRRNGQPYGAAALRGATRCLKHGGRTEVPHHPHNIRRFLTGSPLGGAWDAEGGPTDRDLWEAMPVREQREMLSIVSERTRNTPSRLYFAARIWLETKDQGYQAEKRFLDLFARA